VCVAPAVAISEHSFAFSRHEVPELCKYILFLPRKREQGMPGARCTRGLVCKMHKEMRTRAYRFSGGNPAFPARLFDGLCRALPGERIRLVTVAAGLMAIPIRLDRYSHRQLGTSNGCRDHTVLPYAASIVRLARRDPLTGEPALRTHLRADAAASPHPIPRS
jgi:hypothetical protein